MVYMREMRKKIPEKKILILIILIHEVKEEIIQDIICKFCVPTATVLKVQIRLIHMKTWHAVEKKFVGKIEKMLNF